MVNKLSIIITLIVVWISVLTTSTTVTVVSGQHQKQNIYARTTEFHNNNNNNNNNDYKAIICDLYEIISLPETIPTNTTKSGDDDDDEDDAISDVVEWECQMKNDDGSFWGISYSFSNLPIGFFESYNIISGFHTVELYGRILTNNQNDCEEDYCNGSNTTIQIDLNIPIKITNKPKHNINLSQQQQQQLQQERLNSNIVNPPMGIRTVLVIRGRGLDLRPSMDVRTLGNEIFGNNHTMATQYNLCSNGLLQFVPAVGENIINGVINVLAPTNIRGMYRTDVHNLILQEVVNSIDGPLEQYDHIMIILPKGVKFASAGAYAKFGGWLSVYKDEYGTYPAIQMHEIGHNLGMKHSGEGSKTYNDHTCLMGYPGNLNEMCYNGAKSWFTNWYSNRHVIIFPQSISSISTATATAKSTTTTTATTTTETEIATTTITTTASTKQHIVATASTTTTTDSSVWWWEGKLVGINDYINNETILDHHYVIGKIVVDRKSRIEDDLYISFNRKEGITNGVGEYPNTVTVVQADNIEGIMSKESSLLASIPAFSEYRITNYIENKNDNDDESLSTTTTTTTDLVIQVCGLITGIPDYALVYVYLDNNNNNNNEILNNMPLCTCETDNDCNDMNMCTKDKCLGGRCIHTDVICEEEFVCHIPQCMPSTGECVHELDVDCIWPSSIPSSIPSSTPTISYQPTLRPSNEPSISIQPSTYPSYHPSISNQPSSSPSLQPSSTPSLRPSLSFKPSSIPSSNPSLEPSQFPTPQPTPKLSKGTKSALIVSPILLITVAVVGTIYVRRNYKIRSDHFLNKALG